MERYEQHHKRHEELLRLHNKSLLSPDELPKEKVRRIARTLHLQGFHPDALPSMNALSPKGDFEAMSREVEYYRLYEEAEANEFLERRRREKAYDSQHGLTFSYPEEIYEGIEVEYPDKAMLDGTSGAYAAKLKL